MLQKATEQDRARIVEYCAKQAHINFFLLADIENFGFENSVQDVWLQQEQNRLVGVLLRYFENYLFYAQPEDLRPAEIGQFLSARGARIISAQYTLLERVQPFLQGCFRKRSMLLASLQSASRLLPDTDEVQQATVENAEEIARQYGKIEEFSGLYTGGVQALAQQIAHRIGSGEGVHLYVRKNGQIVAHGNTTAETATGGAIGGVFTLPEFRRQGLAGQIVSALCRSLLARGKTPCLFFDNPDAGRLYYRLGFADSGRWGVLQQECERKEQQ